MERSAADVSFFQLLAPLVRRWRLLTMLPAAFGILALGLSFLVPEIYTASTSFTPAAAATPALPANLGGLLGLAGQLGLGTQTGTATPEFFAAVLESRELLDALLRSEFKDPGTGSPQTLLDLLDIRGATKDERISLGIRRLRRLISPQVDGRTGIVTVSVRQRAPQLAADVANRLSDLLNQFNLERRQSQSRAQSRFIAQRLADAERDLRAAEEALQAFLAANRQYRGSPLLEFEYARLDRVVQLKQEVFTSLSKAHEDARITEVRDTPVLTIIDRAVPPQRRTAPHRTLYVLVAVLLGAAIAAAGAYALEMRARAELTGRGDYRELTDALAQAGEDVRVLLRRRG